MSKNIKNTPSSETESQTNKKSQNIWEQISDWVHEIVENNNSYEMQSRSLESYYAWMNASMATKVWPTMVHLLGSPWSTIIDMGTWSWDAASTYSNIFKWSNIIGVDINPDSVKYCQDNFRDQKNLAFIEGDIEEMVFPENSVDAILNSSTLHHVSSFNDYSSKNIETSIKNQIRQLKDNGMLIIRDFLAPDEDKDIIMELSTLKPTCQDQDWCDHQFCHYCDAELFEIFANTSRSLSEKTGFKMTPLTSNKPWWKKYKLKHKHAIEFVLRKDYRKQWEVENQEEYTYFNQTEFESIFEENWMRIIASYPYYNPWIIQNRFKDKFHFYDSDWNQIDYPATNYVIIGQKIPKQSSYWNKIQQNTKQSLSPKQDFFLKRKSYRHKDTQEVWDLVERPGEVNDIIPYTVDEDTQQVYISAKWWYPRPLIWVNKNEIDKKKFSGYICEPHSMSSHSHESNISKRLGIDENQIQEEVSGMTYFPSPWILSEKVASKFLKCDSFPKHQTLPEYISGFKNSWEARSMEVNDVLKAIQTGTMPEARLEINIYFLLKYLGIKPQEWIGDTISIEQSSLEKRNILTGSDLRKQWTHKSFQETNQTWDYIAHYTSDFEEIHSRNDITKSLGTNTLEYIEPKHQSLNVISILPVIKNSQDGKIYIGLEMQDYPSIQEHQWYSNIWWVPAYRLPKDVTNYTQLEKFYHDNISDTPLQKIWESYKPSIWVSPETIYPYTSAKLIKNQSISYIALEDIYNNIDHLKDMHLIISTLRLYHLYQSQKITIQE